MFTLNHIITINGNTYHGINGVKIERSITTLSGTATIKLPSTAVLKQASGERLNVLTSQMIERGHTVTIDLGYNGVTKREFTGYVTRVNYTTPLEIECEDAAFLLRGKQIKKTYPKTMKATLAKVLSDITEGTNIGVDTGGLNIDIDQLILATEAGGEVPREEALRYVLDRYGLVGYFDTKGTLFVGLRQGKRLAEAKLRLGWNTVKDDELKYHSVDDQKIKIKAIFIDKMGTRTVVEVGDDDGSARTIFLADVADATTMKELAANELQKYKFNGFAGKITAFLTPYAEPGSIIRISDSRYPQREGSYYCEATEVTFDSSGGRRTITIGTKV